MAVNVARETALKILYDINENGAYSNISINKYLEAGNVKDLDKGLITDIVYGSVKHMLTIDYIIGKFSKVKLKKLSPWILNILRMGIYQLLYMNKIPVSAACNESVILAKRYGHAASGGYVNAVLRNVAKSKDNISYPDKEKDVVEYLSIRYSHPQWLVKEFVSRFGSDFTESLLETNNKLPELNVRVNSLKSNIDELITSLEAENVNVEKGKYLKEALVLRNTAGIGSLKSFKNGLFQVQDESSMLVAKILSPKKGELVLDVCSAPGGKTTHIAELMQNEGTVIARDIHPHKLLIIDEAAKRLGITIIKTEQFDAANIDEKYVGKLDKVLVDAPCTGLGIIRKKPDIKWTRKPADIEELRSIQWNILNASSKYLKKDGILVYSTCTILDEENIQIIRAFLEKNQDFELDSLEDFLPDGLKTDTCKQGYIQLYPNVHGVDGFFIARLRKRS